MVFGIGQTKERKILNKWQKKMPTMLEFMELIPLLNEVELAELQALVIEKDYFGYFLAGAVAGEEVKVAEVLTTLATWRDEVFECSLSLLGKFEQATVVEKVVIKEFLQINLDFRLVDSVIEQTIHWDKANACTILAIYGTAVIIELRSIVLATKDIELKLKLIEVLDDLSGLSEGLIALLMTDEVVAVRLLIAGILAEKCDIGRLKEMTCDIEPKVRAKACEGLGKIGGEEIAPIFQAILEHESDWRVRSTCQNYISNWLKEIEANILLDEASLWLKEE